MRYRYAEFCPRCGYLTLIFWVNRSAFTALFRCCAYKCGALVEGLHPKPLRKEEAIVRKAA